MLEQIRMGESIYLPELTDSSQDLLDDAISRLHYLNTWDGNTHKSPFTERQVKVLKMADQANQNAQICLDYGFIPFALLACVGSAGPCMSLTGATETVKISVSYGLSCVASFAQAQLGLMWGGRNTDTSSDKSNQKQNILKEMESEYEVLGLEILEMWKDPAKRDQVTNLVKNISFDAMWNHAQSSTISRMEYVAIVKFFQGTVSKVMGTGIRNIRVISKT